MNFPNLSGNPSSAAENKKRLLIHIMDVSSTQKKGPL